MFTSINFDSFDNTRNIIVKKSFSEPLGPTRKFVVPHKFDIFLSSASKKHFTFQVPPLP